MRTAITLVHVLGLLSLMAGALGACGVQPAGPTATLAGPALIFFYTDP